MDVRGGAGGGVAGSPASSAEARRGAAARLATSGTGWPFGAHPVARSCDPDVPAAGAGRPGQVTAAPGTARPTGAATDQLGRGDAGLEYVSPATRWRCMTKNSSTGGMAASREAGATSGQAVCHAAQRLDPRGERPDGVGLDEHQGPEVVVPDEREDRHGDRGQGRPDQRQDHRPEDPELARPVEPGRVQHRVRHVVDEVPHAPRAGPRPSSEAMTGVDPLRRSRSQVIMSVPGTLQAPPWTTTFSRGTRTKPTR